MRQIWISRHGGPEVLEIREEPDPVPGQGEVRIRVEFSGVNFADVAARIGVYPDAPKPPLVAGYEVSGTVDGVGSGVDPSLLEKPVIAMVNFGGHTDVLCVPVEQIFLRPDTMPGDEGAAIPVSYVTAYQILAVMGSVRPGDKVLIHGAGGGVGTACVQIAQILGASVYGTASSYKHDALRNMGVVECIDYRTVDFVKVMQDITDGQGVDVVVDPIGGHHWMRSYRALAPAGRLVMCGQSGMISGRRRSYFEMVKWLLGVPWLAFNPVRLINDNRAIIGVNMGRMGDERTRLRGWFEQLLLWYQDGKLRPHIDGVYTFAEAAKAHQRLEDRQNIGKVLLKPE